MHRHLLTLLITMAAPVAAQRTWLDSLPGSSLGIVTALAAFDDNVTESPAATMAIQGRYAVADDLALTVELPFAHARLRGGLSGTAAGNPWIGLEHVRPSGLRLELGARINLWPPSSQETVLPFAYGQIIDFDRWEAWFVRASSVRATAHFGRLPADGTFATARLGLAGIASGGAGGDGELFLHYGGRGGIASTRWLGWVGVLGQGIVTESSGSFGERTLHQVELGVASRSEGLGVEVALRRFVAEDFVGSVPIVLRVAVTAGL
jgi:hypothetical protein